MVSDEEMPADPFGAPEDLIQMMKGMYNLYSGAMAAGFPEHVAIAFISGVFVAMVQGAPKEVKESE